MNHYDVIRRPLVTEKGVDKKDNERTLCFEVSAGANKTQVKSAVENLRAFGEGHAVPHLLMRTILARIAVARPTRNFEPGPTRREPRIVQTIFDLMHATFPVPVPLSSNGRSRA